MSVATDKTTEQSQAANPYPGAPVIKDKWTVSSGNYTPKFKIKGCVLQLAGATEANVNFKLRLDDTADVETLSTNTYHPCGDVISALQASTNATTVIWQG